MIANRRAHGATENSALKNVPPRRNEGNAAWLDRVKAEGGLILFGGSSLAQFRIRIAQAHVRRDFLPSFWSLAGIVVRPGRICTVSLDDIGGADSIVRENGIVDLPLKKFDDPVRWPNVAALQFASGVKSDGVESVRHDRAIVDIPTLILKWLAFLWGADQHGNPLLGGHGVPSAAFVAAAYGLARVDLTPGVSSAMSCPEVIWQSAKWWREFYERAQGERRAEKGSEKSNPAAGFPRGNYALRQPAAAVVE